MPALVNGERSAEQVGLTVDEGGRRLAQREAGRSGVGRERVVAGRLAAADLPIHGAVIQPIATHEFEAQSFDTRQELGVRDADAVETAGEASGVSLEAKWASAVEANYLVDAVGEERSAIFETQVGLVSRQEAFAVAITEKYGGLFHDYKIAEKRDAGHAFLAIYTKFAPNWAGRTRKGTRIYEILPDGLEIPTNQ
jgi:hypothetical protein